MVIAMPVIRCEGTAERFGAFVLAFVGVEKFLLSRVANKVELHEHRRHRGGPEDPEAGLADVLIVSSGIVYKLFLCGVGKFEALGEVGVLVELEYYIGFRGIRVEAAVSFLIIVIESHHTVLAHSHGEVVFRLMQSEGIHRSALNCAAFAVAFVYRVDVDRNEEVAFRLVCDLGSLVEGEVFVLVAGVNHFDLRACLPDLVAQFACDGEGDGFLVCEVSSATDVLASVACIYHDREFLFVRSLVAESFGIEGYNKGNQHQD